MDEIGRLMEAASGALVEMSYLECEALCIQALEAARGAGAWEYVARILLPLQEARRQRRMIAAEGVIRLGTTTLTGTAEQWLERMGRGCIVVTSPHGPGVAAEVLRKARDGRKYVEVLYADSAPDGGRWRIASFGGPAVSVEVSAPPAECRDRWLEPGGGSGSDGGVRAADWFLDAMDALGEAAMGTVAASSAAGAVERFERLDACLEVVTDHEILHQRLAEAARGAARGV